MKRMKKILQILLIINLLLACNSSNDKEHKSGTDPAVHEHTEAVSALVLNNGIKWKADSVTITNAEALQAIITSANPKTLEDYRKISAEINEGLNKMIKQCTMKGADHDALHLWLEPLIKNVKELGESSTVEKAAPILHELETQANLFPQYFEK